MTTRREVPLAGDTLAWVHAELAEIKSRLAIAQQAADQSRALASDAADTSYQVRAALGQFDGLGGVIQHLQDDLRALREQLARAQDDIHSLRQSREESERHEAAESERVRQFQNDTTRRFGDVSRQIEAWLERVTGVEEHSRRNLELLSQVAMRLEPIENSLAEADTTYSRTVATLSRLDQEMQRISGAVLALQSEDHGHRERSNTAFEVLRRLETEVEALKGEVNKIGRIEDRVELVQAERTRHNERLNEISAELHAIDTRLNQNDERSALIEARMAALQEDLRLLRENLQLERERLGAYLNSLRDLQADMRKRQIVALEKEIRDIRARAFDVAPE